MILGEARERGRENWEAAVVRMSSRREGRMGWELRALTGEARRVGESEGREEMLTKMLGRPEERMEMGICGSRGEFEARGGEEGTHLDAVNRDRVSGSTSHQATLHAFHDLDWHLDFDPHLFSWHPSNGTSFPRCRYPHLK